MFEIPHCVFYLAHLTAQLKFRRNDFGHLLLYFFLQSQQCSFGQGVHLIFRFICRFQCVQSSIHHRDVCFHLCATFYFGCIVDVPRSFDPSRFNHVLDHVHGQHLCGIIHFVGQRGGRVQGLFDTGQCTNVHTVAIGGHGP